MLLLRGRAGIELVLLLASLIFWTTTTILLARPAFSVNGDSSVELAAGAAGTSVGAASSNAYGDFNGDGKDDLAIGVPSEDIGTILDAGAVNVLYGSSSGLQTSSPADQFWHQNKPGVEDTAEGSDEFLDLVGDFFGIALAVGDFNGDGKDDLAIGVENEDIGTIEDAGAVNVLYGSSSGLQTSSPADQFWHENSPGVRGGSEEGDHFGGSLVAGDFNGDGKDDLAIGVECQDVLGVACAGAVEVLFGSSLGLQATSPDDQRWNQESLGVDDSAGSGDGFGSSLAAGDFNDDGKDDLAIGVPSEDAASTVSDGAVHVLYGSSSGLQTSSPADQFWHQDKPGVEDVAEDFDNFGDSVAAGDLNGDGFDDLAIGVPKENIGTIEDAGAVNVLYGSSSGLRTTVAGDGTGRSDQFWHQNSPGVEDFAEAGDPDFGIVGDHFGSALAAADFNDDGEDDLAIGANLEDIGTVVNAGAVNVLYGSSSGLQTSSPADQFWHQNKPGVEDFAESSDDLGSFLAYGDFNGDGKDDLAVGVPEENVGGESNAGAVNVLYGSSSGLQTSSPADQFWHQGKPGVEDDLESDDSFGHLA